MSLVTLKGFLWNYVFWLVHSSHRIMFSISQYNTFLCAINWLIWEEGRNAPCRLPLGPFFTGGMCSPSRFIFIFNFMQFSEKNGQNNTLAHPPLAKCLGLGWTHQCYSAIHKATIHHSASGWNDLRDLFQPLVPLMASGMEWWNDGIAPDKIMERLATVRPAALWIALLMSGSYEDIQSQKTGGHKLHYSLIKLS